MSRAAVHCELELFLLILFTDSYSMFPFDRQVELIYKYCYATDKTSGAVVSLLLADCIVQVRALLWPRKDSSIEDWEKQLDWYVAVVELLGMFTIKTRQVYDSLDEREVDATMRRTGALEPAEFARVRSAVCARLAETADANAPSQDS